MAINPFRYKFGTPIRGVPNELLQGLADNFRRAATAFAPAATLVTTLPTTPYDGQVIAYRAGNGKVWLFQYSLAGVSGERWEYIGGASYFSATANAIAHPNTAGLMTAPSTQLSIAIPFAGTYLVTIGSGYANCTVAGIGGALGISGPGFASAFNSDAVARADGTSAIGVSTAVTVAATGAGNLVAMCGTGGATVLNMPYGYHMTMTPVRLAG